MTDPGAFFHLHCNENPIYLFPEKELRGLSPNFNMCAIYIFPEWVHIFSCSRIGRPILGIHKSLRDTWMWKLGRWHAIPFLWISVSTPPYTNPHPISPSSTSQVLNVREKDKCCTSSATLTMHCPPIRKMYAALLPPSRSEISEKIIRCNPIHRGTKVFKVQ